MFMFQAYKMQPGQKNVSFSSFAGDFTLFSVRQTMSEAADRMLQQAGAVQDISILLEENGLPKSEEKTASMMIASSFFHQCMN